MAVNKWTLFCSIFVLLVSTIGDVDAQGCDTVYTEPSGTITSPYYPADYRNNMDCDYEIRASQSSSFTLTFETFHLEDSSTCGFDWVQIQCHDGSTVSPKYCGQNDPPTTVINNCDKVVVEFRSDGSETEKGFSLRYSFISGGSTHKPTTQVTTKPTTNVTTKPTTKTSTTAKSTTKMSTISTTSVATNDTTGDIGLCEPYDDVPLIVVSMLLGICILGYIVLAAIFIVRRCRQKTSQTDAESTESPRAENDYAKTQPASRIL